MKKIVLLYYYQKGNGYIAAATNGKLFSCVVPNPQDIESNPFSEPIEAGKKLIPKIRKPFSKYNAYNTFAIKGIAYYNLLDGGYGGIMGLEKSFVKNQSVGLKYSYDLATPHTENTADGSNGTIDYSHNKNLSFILEYKYYLDFNFLQNYILSPYVPLS